MIQSADKFSITAMGKSMIFTFKIYDDYVCVSEFVLIKTNPQPPNWQEAQQEWDT